MGIDGNERADTIASEAHHHDEPSLFVPRYCEARRLCGLINRMRHPHQGVACGKPPSPLPESKLTNPVCSTACGQIVLSLQRRCTRLRNLRRRTVPPVAFPKTLTISTSFALHLIKPGVLSSPSYVMSTCPRVTRTTPCFHLKVGEKRVCLSCSSVLSADSRPHRAPLGVRLVALLYLFSIAYTFTVFPHA